MQAERTGTQLALGHLLAQEVKQILEFYSKVYKSRYHANGKALAMNETEGLVKLLTDADDHILGCHILGAHASDLIQEVVAWMNQNGTIQQLRECVHIHPTLSEVLQDLA